MNNNNYGELNLLKNIRQTVGFRRFTLTFEDFSLKFKLCSHKTKQKTKLNSKATYVSLNCKDDDESRANDPSRVRQSREVEKEYPPDTPDLNRDMVMLDIPSTLYGLSADISLRASEVIGRLIQVGTFLNHFRYHHRSSWLGLFFHF